MRERDIFDAALAISDPAARSAYLDKVSAGNPGLREHLNELLAMHAQLGSFLEAPAPSLVATVDDPVHERPGTMIGPYKLLEEIGEGGMGLVFVAEQQEPIKRRVALKIIKPGMDSRQVIARFEAERQALALMDHPHIAKVFDGGTTREGRPYFVMELVKGTPITDYCDAHRFTNRLRLQLFLDVCHAVQHAHQKGIIHRDLKPSNVMVSLHDVTPVVKVIDFGIAKATSGRLTDKTVYTAFAQMVGSPLYMSPEQAGQSDIDVDTRSDVYSLGVLLYELLTGTTPFDSEQFNKASDDEMRRIIREDEPLRPSTRLSTMQQATLSTIAERRGLEPRRLSQQVRGELDWIVMKALEKDRNRRYESASAFAADVQRYLDDEPVQACPPSTAYRLRKFAWRNRGRLAASAFLLLSGLVVACLFIAFHLQSAGRLRQLSQGVREALAGARTAIEADNLTLANQRVAEAQGRLGTDADKLRELAAEVDGVQQEIAAREAEESRFQRFRKLAAEVENSEIILAGEMGDLSPKAEETLGLYGVLTDEDWIASLGTNYLTTAQKQQVREAAYVVLLVLADYLVRWTEAKRMGPETEAEATARALGLLRRAEAFHQPTRAFYFIRSVCHSRQGKAAATEEDAKRYKAMDGITAWDYFLPGRTAAWAQDKEEARRSYLAALRLQPDHVNSLFFLAEHVMRDPKINRIPEAVQLYTACIALRPDSTLMWINRFECYLMLGKLEEAKADFIALIKKVESRLGADQHDSLNQIAWAYLNADLLPEAIALLERTLPKSKATLGPDHESTLHSMSNLARAYLKAQRLQEAIPLFERTLEKEKAALGPDHRETLVTTHNLAVAYLEALRLQEAIPLFEQTLEKEKAAFGVDHKSTLLTMLNLAFAYLKAQRFQEAIPLFEQTLEKEKAAFGVDHKSTLVTMHNLAAAYSMSGKLDQAERLFRDIVERQRKINGPKSSETAGSLAMLGNILLDQQKYAEAEPILRECLTIRVEKLPDHWLRYNAESMLGGALLNQKKYAEAEPLLLQGYEGMKQRESQIPPQVVKIRLAEAAQRLVRYYEATNQTEKTKKWRAKLAEDEKASGTLKRP